MKFAIVAYPSKFSEIGYNYLLIRISDGAIVGMIDESAVDDLRQALGMGSNVSKNKDKVNMTSVIGASIVDDINRQMKLMLE